MCSFQKICILPLSPPIWKFLWPGSSAYIRLCIPNNFFILLERKRPSFQAFLLTAEDFGLDSYSDHPWQRTKYLDMCIDVFWTRSGRCKIKFSKLWIPEGEVVDITKSFSSRIKKHSENPIWVGEDQPQDNHYDKPESNTRREVFILRLESLGQYLVILQHLQVPTSRHCQMRREGSIQQSLLKFEPVPKKVTLNSIVASTPLKEWEEIMVCTVRPPFGVAPEIPEIA